MTLEDREEVGRFFGICSKTVAADLERGYYPLENFKYPEYGGRELSGWLKPGVEYTVRAPRNTSDVSFPVASTVPHSWVGRGEKQPLLKVRPRGNQAVFTRIIFDGTWDYE